MLEKTLENPLDCKEIQLVHPKGNQSWIFIGRTDAEAETPILWPPDAKNRLIWKDPDAGKDWRQEEKGTTEDEMVGWHHRLKGHEFEQAPGAGDGQGSLVCCSPWGHKESDTTEQLNWIYEMKKLAKMSLITIINDESWTLPHTSHKINPDGFYFIGVSYLLCIYCLLAALGLGCWAQASLTAVSRGCSLLGHLGSSLWCCLSVWSTGCGPKGSVAVLLSLVASQHMKSSWVNGRAHIPCFGRWIFTHHITRKVPQVDFRPQFLKSKQSSRI